MIQHKDLDDPQTREVIVVGGGIAGLSAAIYLGRAQRDTLVIVENLTHTARSKSINACAQVCRDFTLLDV